ncbi:MAG: hypothetical protein M3535_07545 [Actinomycetota bacterium]|nr:hypothetical protein [Actinomycetota bacterium]
MPTVAGRALIVAPCRSGQTLGAEPSNVGAHCGVVEGGVKDDVENVVQQRQAPHPAMGVYQGLRRSADPTEVGQIAKLGSTERGCRCEPW